MSDFGFTIKKHMKYISDPRGWKYGREEWNGNWDVYLPHSCDSWEIAGDEMGEGGAYDEVVADLEAFIAEAQEALQALKDKREYGDISQPFVPSSQTCHLSFQEVIFNHDFARALWGEEPYAKVVWPHPDYELKSKATSLVFTPLWQYHLMMMVIAEDPVAYLGEHMPEDK